MSELLRVALVAEGPTDKILIQSAITSILGTRPFVLRQLQPEESLAFGPTGTGWAGVYHWCRQAASRNHGNLRDDVLYFSYDLLILHLDADVAGKRYTQANILENIQDLPCNRPCPPTSDSTDPLRRVILRWVGETEMPPKTVFCTPSKNMEAWLVFNLFPSDLSVVRGIECFENPEARLSQQPAVLRIKKRIEDYLKVSESFTSNWPRLAAELFEASRFQRDFLLLCNQGELY